MDAEAGEVHAVLELLLDLLLALDDVVRAERHRVEHRAVVGEVLERLLRVVGHGAPQQRLAVDGRRVVALGDGVEPALGLAAAVLGVAAAVGAGAAVGLDVRGHLARGIGLFVAET